MRLSIVFVFSMLLLYPGFTQTVKSVALVDCYEKAKAAYPLSEKGSLLQQSQAVRLEKLDAQKLPSVFWNAQASIQSENVELPFESPAIPSLDLPLYRFQTTVDATYTIYDGGLINVQKDLEQVKLRTEQKSIEVALEGLKPRVNQLFFSAMLLEKKVAILENTKSNIENKIETLQAGVRHGVVLEGEVKKLEVEVLRLQSQIEENQGTIKGLKAHLSSLTGLDISQQTALILPDEKNYSFPSNIQRLELELFQLQKEQILANESMITAAKKPKFGAFIQAGVGYPNPLNFFEDQISPFAIAGLQFSWKIFDWKQSDRDRQLLTLQSQLVDNQRAVFEKNIDVREEEFQIQFETLEQLIKRDGEIGQLQKEILEQVSAQLDRGVVTSSIYIDQVNAEVQAQLSLETHLLQLQKAKIEYLTHKGAL